MAGKKDPTITTEQGDPAEGSHPARPASEVTHNAARIKYSENPDKPDSSSVAQVADIPDDFPGQQ